MKLTDRFDKGEYVITSEVGPAKGCLRRDEAEAPPDLVREALEIQDYVHAINVTDNQSAVMRAGSLAAAVLLSRHGIDPVYQVTCRDRNRIALQSDLLSACSLGIDNVLCITGDYTSLGDHRSAKSVFDIDSVHLLKVARGLNEGRDMEDHALTRATALALGAVVNPNFEPLDLQLMKMEKKIEAGARFFQTQAVYDPRIYERFARKVEGFGVPVQLGVVTVKSARMGRFMNDNVSGITVPDWIINEMGSVDKAGRKARAIEITERLIREMGPMAQGIHFMPLGWSDVVAKVVTAFGGRDRMTALAN